MSNKKLSLPSSRRHILVFDEDWDWLESHYGTESGSKIGVGVAIRTILHARISDMKAKANAEIDRRRGSEAKGGKDE